MDLRGQACLSQYDIPRVAPAQTRAGRRRLGTAAPPKHALEDIRTIAGRGLPPSRARAADAGPAAVRPSSRAGIDGSTTATCAARIPPRVTRVSRRQSCERVATPV